MNEFGFKITEECGVIRTLWNGWPRELNRVSWNGREPKLDIRDLSPDHTKMTRGIQLTEEDARMLLELMKEALK